MGGVDINIYVLSGNWQFMWWGERYAIKGMIKVCEVKLG